MNYINFRSDPVNISLLVLLCAILYLPSLGRIPFFNKGEPREALVVQSIVKEGGWLFPLKGGSEVPSKPPLFHWMAALCSLAWGEITEATVRFPSASFAILGVVSVYILGRSVFDPLTALLGGVILATSFVYQKQAVEARVDMTLAFFVTLSLVIFYLLYRAGFRNRAGMLCFYAILGLAVLSKGPVGLILPGLVISGFLGLKKRWDLLSGICLHRGVFITVAIGVSWYALALARGGEEFFNRQILHENLARFFVYGEDGTGHQKPIYYYIPYLFLEGLPWSLFLPIVIADWIRNRLFSEEHSLFLMFWAAVVFVFFSLSAGKRPVYLLPLYFPLALLTARWFQRAKPLGKIEVIWLPLLGGIFFLACIPLTVVLLGQGLPDFLSSLLRSRDEAQWLLLGNVPAQEGWYFLILVGIMALICVFLTWDLFRLRVHSVPIKMFLLSVVSWSLAQGTFVPAIAHARSYGPFIEEASRVAPCNQLYLYGEDIDSSSLDFYCGGPLPRLEGDRAALLRRLRSMGGHVIMSKRESEGVLGLGESLPPPLLSSEGSGPDGDAPLVLIRGANRREKGPGSG